MRRLLSGLMLLLVAGLAGACGSSTKTITLTESVSGQTISLVASGDSSTIDAEKAGAANSGGTITDGDTHTGDKICETDVNDQGKTFHVVVYSTVSLPATTCDQMKSGIGG